MHSSRKNSYITQLLVADFRSTGWVAPSVLWRALGGLLYTVTKHFGVSSLLKIWLLWCSFSYVSIWLYAISKCSADRFNACHELQFQKGTYRICLYFWAIKNFLIKSDGLLVGEQRLRKWAVPEAVLINPIAGHRTRDEVPTGSLTDCTDSNWRAVVHRNQGAIRSSSSSSTTRQSPANIRL